MYWAFFLNKFAKFKVQRGLIFNFQGSGVGSSSDPTLVTSGKAQKVPLDAKKIEKIKKEPVLLDKQN